MTHNEIMMTNLGDSDRSFAWFVATVIGKFINSVVKDEDGLIAVTEDGFRAVYGLAELSVKDENPIFDMKVLDTKYTFRENMKNIQTVFGEARYNSKFKICVLPKMESLVCVFALFVIIPKGYNVDTDSIDVVEDDEATV